MLVIPLLLGLTRTLASPVGEEGYRRFVRLRIETSYEFYLSPAMRQVLKPSCTICPCTFASSWSIVLMHQFPFVVGSCCTWHWHDLDWNQQAQGIGCREAGTFCNQLELNSFLVNYTCYEACINIIFSFVLGTCCYSGWHWLHLESNREAGWAT
jgi:hypothetical protein